jgi:phosphoribosylanthranilate isomerase
VRVKICGLSTPDTIEAAIRHGASHVGLVHFPRSPRHTELAAARALRDQAHGRAKVVLLLVDAAPGDVANAAHAVRPDIVQFHGAETPEQLAAYRTLAPVGIWKAIGLRDTAGLTAAAAYAGAVDLVLYDAPAQSLPGGTGTRFDWSLLAGHRHALPWGLAGGLTPDNVAAAITETGAPLVDVSSGVESAPGIKDVDKMAAFLKAARL